MKIFNKKKFDALKDTLKLLANLAVLSGVIFAVIQIRDYRVKSSAELVLRFGEYLDEDPYLSISQVLDTSNVSTKILQPAGRFSSGEIDRYLGTFETLGDLYYNGLITFEMLDINFSYYIQKAYSNEEIRAYVMDAHRTNPKWWTNFIQLGELFKEETHRSMEGK